MKKGSAEAKAWGRKMQALRKAKHGSPAKKAGGRGMKQRKGTPYLGM